MGFWEKRARGFLRTVRREGGWSALALILGPNGNFPHGGDRGTGHLLDRSEVLTIEIIVAGFGCHVEGCCQS